VGSATEVDAVVNKVDISVSAYASAPRSAAGRRARAKVAVRHKPHGVLAVLGPYNFPAHLPNGHIVPALIAGNAVVFKPSPRRRRRWAICWSKLLPRGGRAGGVRPLLHRRPGEGKALAAHPGIDGLLFTGSARAGLALHRQFADTPQKILALELGGNNPLVVWDAPTRYAAATIAVQSAFLSAGQRCTAARRLIVKDGAHEAADRGAIVQDRRPADRRSSARQPRRRSWAR
jgi:succinylglutamic semialdehyde dehydrogenase